jgi:hypothetical protein
VVDVGRVKSDNVAANEVAVRFLYVLGLADVVMYGFVEAWRVWRWAVEAELMDCSRERMLKEERGW